MTIIWISRETTGSTSFRVMNIGCYEGKTVCTKYHVNNIIVIFILEHQQKI